MNALPFFPTKEAVAQEIKKIALDTEFESLRTWLKRANPEEAKKFFSNTIAAGNIQFLLLLQKNKISPSPHTSIFQTISACQEPIELASPLFQVIEECCKNPREYHVEKSMKAAPRLSQDIPAEFVKAMFGGRIQPSQWLPLLHLNQFPTSIKNDLLLQANLKARYEKLKEKSASDAELLRCAWLLERHFPHNVDLENIDYRAFRKELFWMLLSPESIGVLVDTLKELGTTNTTLNAILVCYERLFALGKKTKRLAASEALEHACIIQYEIPKLFQEIGEDNLQKSGFRRLNESEVQSPRVFWQPQEGHSLVIYLPTHHAIGLGSFNRVTTGIRIKADLLRKIYVVIDLLAYQEQFLPTPQSQELLTCPNLIEAIGQGPGILQTYFVAVFPEKISNFDGHTMSLFCELCGLDASKLTKKDFFALAKKKSTEKHFESFLERLIVFYDALWGLEQLHSKEIAHADFKLLNILTKKDAGGLLRGRLFDWATSIQFPEQNAQSQSNVTYFTIDRQYPTGFLSSPDIQEGVADDEEEKRDQIYKADSWAAGISLYQFLAGSIPEYQHQLDKSLRAALRMRIIHRKKVEPSFSAKDNRREAKKLKQKIAHFQLEIHAPCSPLQYAVKKTCSLLQKLLTLNYKKRPSPEQARLALGKIILASAHHAKKQGMTLSGKFEAALQEMRAEA